MSRARNRRLTGTSPSRRAADADDKRMAHGGYAKPILPPGVESEGGYRLDFHPKFLVQQLVHEQQCIRRIAVREPSREDADAVFDECRQVVAADQVIGEM